METLSASEQRELLYLLKQKLSNIASDVLPTITLTDILLQTPKASYLPNIPADIQLHYLLTNRPSTLTGTNIALKSPTQPLALTRAVFFYRLSPDTTHQFQRYHDSHRWNVAIFLALLTLPDHDLSTSRYSPNGIHFPVPARRFIIAYLDAVLEHHGADGRGRASFSRREKFVQLWKTSAYDFFHFRTAQKKVMKGVMKKMSLAWENELDRAKVMLGEEEYEKRVARFVGVLVPGRKDQRARSYWVPDAPVVGEKEVGKKLVEGTLLKALKVPLKGEGKPGNDGWDEDVYPVADVRKAIIEVQRMLPREVLGMLLHTFPEG